MFSYFEKKPGMLAAIKAKDWAGCARRYNGCALPCEKYATKIGNAYNLYKSGQLPANRELNAAGTGPSGGGAISAGTSGAGCATGATAAAGGASGTSPVGGPLPSAEGSIQSVANAIEELKFWGEGTLKEPYHKTNKPGGSNFQKTFDRLFLYWKNLGGSREWITKDRIESQSAWSAATISYFYRHDPSFPKGGGHQKYMRACQKNRSEGATTGWLAFRPEEIKELAPGDIVCAGRSQDGSGISTWERIQPYNHCDMCITRDKAVGGNVGNTCKVSSITYVNQIATGLGSRSPTKTPIMIVLRKVGSANPDPDAAQNTSTDQGSNDQTSSGDTPPAT
jgi:hypothetical protein